MEIITDTTEIQRIERNCYEELYTKNISNLGEMDKFLEKYNLPKLSQEKAESLNRAVTVTDEIEAVIKKLLVQKSPGLDSFTGKFYKTFKEELTPMFLRLFQKIQEEERLPNSFYETSIILIPKSNKDKTKKRTIGQYH